MIIIKLNKKIKYFSAFKLTMFVMVIKIAPKELMNMKTVVQITTNITDATQIIDMKAFKVLI